MSRDEVSRGSKSRLMNNKIHVRVPLDIEEGAKGIRMPVVEDRRSSLCSSKFGMVDILVKVAQVDDLYRRSIDREVQSRERRSREESKRSTGIFLVFILVLVLVVVVLGVIGRK